MNKRRRDSLYAQIEQNVLKKIISLGIISLAVALVAFFLGNLLFFQFLRLNGMAGRPIDWSLLDGFTGLVAVALVIGGMVFALVEYVRSETQQARDDAQMSYAIYESLFNRLMAVEETESRRWIIENLPMKSETQSQEEYLAAIRKRIREKPDDWQAELSPGQQHVKRALNTLDFFGFAAENYWNVEGALMEWMSPPIAKVWKRLSLYVADEANRRQEPDWYKSARYIGEKCVRWRRDHNLPEEIVVKDTL